MTVETWDTLRSIARLNRAVWCARERLIAAWAGSSWARKELLRAHREVRPEQPRWHVEQQVTKAALEEAEAEAALKEAVAAWRSSSPTLRAAYRAGLPKEKRFGSTHPDGYGFAETMAALVARFGPPTGQGSRHDKVPRAHWNRDTFGRFVITRSAEIGLVEDGGRVRVYARANAFGHENLHVDVSVWVEARVVSSIEMSYINSGHDVTPVRDPNRSREDEKTERDWWRPWSWSAPEDAKGLLRRDGHDGPMLGTPALAAEAVALMLDTVVAPPEQEEG